MLGQRKRRRRGLGLIAGAAAAFVLQVGPCGNLQDPPANTELFWGVAIATGAEVAAPTTSAALPEQPPVE